MLRGCSVGRQPSLWAQLKKLRLPVLLIAGQQDGKYMQLMRQMQQQIPGARLHVVPGAGHAVVEEQAPRVALALNNFLRGNGRRNKT
jgi:pimeloyl-ACP methyl ester carboxylesterase